MEKKEFMTQWCMPNNTDMSIKHYLNVFKNSHVIMDF